MKFPDGTLFDMFSDAAGEMDEEVGLIIERFEGFAGKMDGDEGVRDAGAG